MHSCRRITLSAILLALSSSGCYASTAENVEALIKRQSQEFSDASASGDAAVLDRYLDERVTFMDESGNLSSKKDILAGAGPSPKGVSNALVQSDWGFQRYGSVAVTSFTDASTFQFHGQTLYPRYRSIEVWIEQGKHWRMISSQTIAVQKDPPTVTLPNSVLDEYVGTYEAGPDFTLKIARNGDELNGSVGDGKPFAIKAELRDVLFTPGQPRTRRIFQRDADGKVTGFVSRREGHDVLLKRIS